MGERDDRKRAIPILRRSPRFLQGNRGDQADDSIRHTPEPRGTRCPSSDPRSRSIRTVSSDKTQKPNSDEVSEDAVESIGAPKSSNRPNYGLRRSARLANQIQEFCCRELSLRDHSEKWVTRSSSKDRRTHANENIPNASEGRLGKRLTRSSYRANANQDAGNIVHDGSTQISGNWVLLGSDRTNEMLGSSKRNKVKRVRNRLHSRKGITDAQTMKIVQGKCDGLKSELTDETEKRRVSSSDASLLAISGAGEMVGNSNEQKYVGVKRKPCKVDERGGVVQGWTKDQELALKRAYFTEEPTPHFWKKVARMVPRKSAQDCFDKVHSSHLTPPQRQPHSRTGAISSSPPAFSASSLLNSLRPNNKYPKYGKNRTHFAQKTVRHLLQKQFQLDQDSEIDLFSILEPALRPSTQASTLDHDKENPEILKRCRNRPSPTRTINHSWLRNSSETAIVSPPVLKQVKNKFLHEKYVDLLHRREAKRKAESVRTSKGVIGRGIKIENQIQHKDAAIKAARLALVFDARDAITKFQHVQANALTSISDDDGIAEDDDDEDEGEGDKSILF